MTLSVYECVSVFACVCEREREGISDWLVLMWRIEKFFPLIFASATEEEENTNQRRGFGGDLLLFKWVIDHFLHSYSDCVKSFFFLLDALFRVTYKGCRAILLSWWWASHMGNILSVPIYFRTIPCTAMQINNSFSPIFFTLLILSSKDKSQFVPFEEVLNDPWLFEWICFLICNLICIKSGFIKWDYYLGCIIWCEIKYLWKCLLSSRIGNNPMKFFFPQGWLPTKIAPLLVMI